MLTARLDSLWPQWRAWIAITRLDNPVGSYLLLWPTFWALWTAAEGMPSLSNHFYGRRISCALPVA